MKIRTFSPGDHVAKINWDNKVIDHGVVVRLVPPRGDFAQVLFPSGLRWEAAHDLIPADEVPHRNK